MHDVEHSPPRPDTPPALGRLGDIALHPIMRVLGGFRSDVIQETHPWHVQPISPDDVDLSQAVTIEPLTDETVERSPTGPLQPLFHAPIFGGWKHYTVLGVDASSSQWHIGWIVRERESRKLTQAAVHRLVLEGDVRMLNGPRSKQTSFFAVNNEGVQLPLFVHGEGILGDKAYPDTRLL